VNKNLLLKESITRGTVISHKGIFRNFLEDNDMRIEWEEKEEEYFKYILITDN